ncbi:MAG: hypothetical protein GF388_02225 [Candidatus Aegiribacteria sp.]|nr:hypothetical protein [Candidatus Aegiribacteria sp.]MBD3294139.1 hypothetical protein [Candidatus Fermentibacteria bacterium]
MQSCAQWLKETLGKSPDMRDEALNVLGEPPPPSVYQELEGHRRIVIHHSATATGCARVFRALHRGVNGWIDVGYHFVIGNGSMSGDGEIETGRPEWAVGAHARENNNDSIGVCLVGNFDETAPTERQLSSMSQLLAGLMDDYCIEEDCILLHRDVPPCRTRCPGTNLTGEVVHNSLLKGRN